MAVVTDPELDGLVTRIHGAIHHGRARLDHDCVRRLRFVPKTPPGDGAVRMVYLLKQGTFYPFAPTGPNQRDNELELRVRSFVVTTFRWRRISRAGWRSGTSRSPSERTRRSRCRLSNQALRVLEVQLVRPPRRGSTVKAQSSVAEHHLGVMVEPFGERTCASRSRTPLG